MKSSRTPLYEKIGKWWKWVCIALAVFSLLFFVGLSIYSYGYLEGRRDLRKEVSEIKLENSI